MWWVSQNQSCVTYAKHSSHSCNSPAGVLAQGCLLIAAVPAAEVVVGPTPGMVTHLVTHLRLLHLLLKAHGRQLKRHWLMWWKASIHGRRGHLHWHALLPLGNEAIGGCSHRHSWEGHW